MNTSKNIEVFETMPIFKSVLKMALPTMLGMLVTIAYNIADTMFVGWTGDSNQVAAVSVAMPVFLLLMAFGNIFAVGGGSLISRTLGEKNYEKVKQVSSFCAYTAAAIGLITMVVYFCIKNWVLDIIGTSENTIDFARSYLDWISAGAVFIVLQYALGGIIRSEGEAKKAVKGMMIGTIVNIVLDPIFILVFNWGVAGAAIATVIGNICSCIYYIYYFLNKKTLLSLSLKHFSLNRKIINGVLAIGIPASLTNILMSISNIIMNIFLSGYGDVHLAAMGVAMKANMLLILLQIGLGIGIQPLIGYSYGAKNYLRLKKCIRVSTLMTVALGTTLTAIYAFFTQYIVRSFIADEQVVHYGVLFLRVLICVGPFVGIMFIIQFSLQAMGKALPALCLAISRQGFIFIPIVIIGNELLGLKGIIWAQPVADFISLFTALGIFLYFNKKEMKTKSAINAD